MPEKYDEEFFKEKVLIVVAMPKSTLGNSYEFDEICFTDSGVKVKTVENIYINASGFSYGLLTETYSLLVAEAQKDSMMGIDNFELEISKERIEIEAPHT